MVVFHELCTTAQSSRVHQTDSVSVMGHEQSATLCSTGWTRNIKTSAAFQLVWCVPVDIVQSKSSEGEVRSFPPAHQLQLNNRRKPVVTAATTTDTQSAVS